MLRLVEGIELKLLAARFANLPLYKRRNNIPRKLHCPHSVQTATKCSDSCKKVDQQDQLRNPSKLLSSTIRCFDHTRNKDLDLYPSLCDFLSPPGHICICLNSLDVDKGLCFAYVVQIDKRWISLFKHEKFEVPPNISICTSLNQKTSTALLLVMTCTVPSIACYSTHAHTDLLLLVLNLWTE